MRAFFKLLFIALLAVSANAYAQGNALQFQSISGFVDLSNSSILKPTTTAITVEAWVHRADWAAPITGTIVSNTEGGGYSIFVSADGGQATLGTHLNAFVRRNGIYGFASWNANILSPGWHHVAFSYDRRYIRLYVDGELKSIDDAGGNYDIQYGTGSNNVSTLIGAEPNASSKSEYFTGIIDEVRFWNSARTKAQIVLNMYGELSSPGSESDLLAYYQLNESSGSSTAADSKGLLTGSLSSTPNRPSFITSYAMIVPSNPNTTNTTSAGFDANWSAPSSGSADKYLLDVSARPDFATKVSGYSGKDMGNATSTTVTFTGFDRLATYYWRVRAVNNSITGPGVNTPVQKVEAVSPGYSMDFLGNSGYISLTATPKLRPTNAITIETWVYRSNWAAKAYERIISCTESAGWSLGIDNGFDNATGTNITVLLRRNGAYTMPTWNASGLKTGWHHVAFTYDGRYTKLYVDGIQRAINDAGGTYPMVYSSLVSTLIGAEPGANSVRTLYFTGRLDEMRIWNAARTPQQIVENMYNNMANPGEETNLLAYYKFNGPSGNAILVDETGLYHGSIGTAPGLTESYAMVAPSSLSTTNLSETGFTVSWSAPLAGTAEGYFLDISTDANFTTFVSGYNNKNMGMVTSENVLGNPAATTYFWRVRSDKTGVATTGSGCFTQTQTVTITPGQALSFSGSGQYVNLSSLNQMQGSYAFTTEAWVYWEGTTSSYADICSKLNVFKFAITNNNELAANYGAGNSYGTEVKSSSKVPLNTWTHVAATRDGSGNVKLYINGILDASTGTNTNYTTNNSNNVFIGAQNGAESYFKGRIDELRIWTAKRSVSDLIANMNNSIAGNESDLLAYYRMDYNTGTTLGDKTTDATYYDGAVTGATWVESFAMVAPQNPYTSSQTSTSFTANWSPSKEGIVNSYILDVSADETFATSLSGYPKDVGDVLSEDITGLTEGTVYYWRVKAEKTTVTGQGVYSHIQTPQPGKALTLNGVNQYVELGDIIEGQLEFTTEAWIYWEGSATDGEIITKDKVSSMRITSGDKLAANFGDGTNYGTEVVSTTSIPTNKWTHVAVTRDVTGRVRLYINGFIETNPVSTTTNTLSGGNSSLRCIGSNGTSNYFKGKIDEVRIWNIQRSGTSIYNNLYKTLSGMESNLLAYYRMDYKYYTNYVEDNTNDGVIYPGLIKNGATLTESYAMVMPRNFEYSNLTETGFTAEWAGSELGAVDNYVIQVATDPNFEDLVPGYEAKSVGLNYSEDVTGLTPGQMYYWRVRADKSSVTGQANYSVEQIVDVPLPVTLSSFTAAVSGRDVKLNWTTASEQNNSGFSIERINSEELIMNKWQNVGYIKGNGTTSTPQTYTFEDKKLSGGKYNYRLKQIDHNGNFEYHTLSGEVEVGLPMRYELGQNYPNPFNPTTKIDFQLPMDSKVSLIIYDITGREIKRLINNEMRKADYYTVQFEAQNISSGVYFYRIAADKFVQTKKMVLIK